jgi:hypothetical protein
MSWNFRLLGWHLPGPGVIIGATAQELHHDRETEEPLSKPPSGGSADR